MKASMRKACIGYADFKATSGGLSLSLFLSSDFLSVSALFSASPRIIFPRPAALPQICVSHLLPRPTCHVHRHLQERRLEFENDEIVSNFLSRPVPFRPRRNVRKRGSLQSDVCARWVVLSHRCHCQGVVAVHCPGSRHELASLPCRPYMHFQRTHM